MSTADIATAFAEAIAGWDQKIQCDLELAVGRPCRRTAAWRVRQHDCAVFFMCTQHFNAQFVHVAEDSIAKSGSVRCRYCKEKFRTIGAAFTAVRL